jgi:hypothetical protein
MLQLHAAMCDIARKLNGKVIRWSDADYGAAVD